MAIFVRAIGRTVARAVISRSVSRMTTRGVSNRLNRTIGQRNSMRGTARSVLRLSSGGLMGQISELAEEIGELYEEAGQLVEAAYYDAMDTMYGMCGNAGQETVFYDSVMPAFADEASSTEIGEEWNDVDIGEYMIFMGEIVEAGNQIMAEAYSEAAGLADEAEDAEVDLDELEAEGISEDEFF